MRNQINPCLEHRFVNQDQINLYAKEKSMIAGTGAD
jgi:hypothetical protein